MCPVFHHPSSVLQIAITLNKALCSKHPAYRNVWSFTRHLHDRITRTDKHCSDVMLVMIKTQMLHYLREKLWG